LQKIEGVVTGISANGKAIVDGVTTDLTAAPDQIGVNVVYYKNSSTNKLISSTLSNGKTTILGTSTDGAALADLGNPDKSAYIASKDTSVTYYLNGGKSNETAVSTAVKAGVIIDLIDNDNNGKYDVVRATVKTVATVGDKGVTISKASSTAKEDAVSIDGIAEISNVAVSRVKGYTDLVKGDVVLYVKVGNTYYLETAESVTGVITGTKKVSNGSLGYLLGGDAYTVSGLVADPLSEFDNGFNKDLTLYLDNNGSIVKLVFDTEAESNDYVLVAETAWINTQGVGAQKGYGQALLVFPDGTTEVATVSKVGSDKAEANGNKIKNLDEGSFYSYKLDSNGEYVLSLNAKKYENSAISNANITTGKALFDGKHVGNNSTVFILKNGDKYNVYTGIANVPGTKKDATVNGNALINSKSNVASYVYISNGDNTTSATSESTVYFLDKDSYKYTPETETGKNDGYYTYDAIVDGKVDTVDVATDAQSLVATGLMAVTYDKSTGHITHAKTDVANAITGNSNGKVSGGTIKVGTKYYTYTDDCGVFLINKDTRAVSVTTMDSVTANESATVVGVVKNASAANADSTTLKALYIEYTPASGGTTGETATGFTVNDIAFTPGARKVTFSANVKANNADATGNVDTVVTAYMLSGGEWVKMNNITDQDTMTSGTAAISTDIVGVKGTTYKFEVTVTYSNETTTITSDAVMIVAE
ncbi:hypothetical protein, partial [Pseudoflavonifractor phocaeensis]|uniref:hypothetical protein n=1 Tax=Pseudoflavonifractor phocaeensis TaxID=1870988 RepID=UPI00210944FD